MTRVLVVVALTFAACRSMPDAGAQLLEASRAGDRDDVRRLLADGGEVGARDGGGATALHLAARVGHDGIVRQLLRNGADVNARRDSDGATPLHEAAEGGHEEVARLLLGAGARPGSRTSDGRSPSAAAALEGQEAVVELLRAAEAGPLDGRLRRVADSFRVLAFNLRLAATDVRDPGGQIVSPAEGLGAVAEFLRRETEGRWGLVGLQEADQYGSNSGCVPQAALLAAGVHTDRNWEGVFTSSYATRRDNCPGRPQTERGNAVLSNIAIEKLQEHALAWTRDAPLNDQGDRPRSMTAIKVAFPSGRKLWFVNTHLDGEGFGKVAMQQIFEVLGHVKTFDPDLPVVIVGDFNIKRSGEAAFRPHYERLGSVMEGALLENAFPFEDGQYTNGNNLKMHVWLYDPHDVLTVTRAEVLPPLLERSDGTYTVSDHNVPCVDLRFH